MPEADAKPRVRFRAPTAKDGKRVWEMVHEAGTLDRNSAYLYILLCDQFSETCAIAEMEGEDGSMEAVGFLTGLIPPKKPDTFFVWQVATLPAARGQGVAGRMIRETLSRPVCSEVNHLEATVGPSNTASDRLFRGFARRVEAEVVVSEGYPEDVFPQPDTSTVETHAHEAEPLYRIGPFTPLSRAAS